MASTATWTAVLTISGDAGSQAIPMNAAPNQASPANGTLVSFPFGQTSLSVPASATRFSFQPTPGNTQPYTIRGASGDAGFPGHPTDPTSIALSPGLISTIIINNTGTTFTARVWFS